MVEVKCHGSSDNGPVLKIHLQSQHIEIDIWRKSATFTFKKKHMGWFILCQFEQTKRCPGNWKNMISECLRGFIWKRSAIDSIDWVEMHPQPWRARIIQLTEDLSGPKVEGGHILSPSEMRHPPFSALRHQSSWLSGLQTPGPTPAALWFQGLQIWTELHHWLSWWRTTACKNSQPPRILSLHDLWPMTYNLWSQPIPINSQSPSPSPLFLWRTLPI